MLPSRHDLSKLLDLVYDAAEDPSRWHLFLAQLGPRARATSAALVIHDLDHALCGVFSSWELDPSVNRLYQDHYHSLDVWAKKRTGLLKGQVRISESLCPLRELRATEFYNDLLVKAKIEHAAFAVPENSKSCLASLSLYRDRSRPPFAEPDLHILQFLVPHIERAFRLHLRFSQLKALSVYAEAALDMLPTGVIFIDSSRKIVHLNRSATMIAAEKDGLLATRIGLLAEQPTESTLLTKAIQQAVSTSSGHSLSVRGTILVSRRLRPPLQIFICPIRNPLIQSAKGVAAVVFINDPLRPQRPAQAVLQTLYRLTPAECRVALLFSDGHAPKEIAEKIGVTDSTVRSQIKSIFSKTGVKRQAELVRLLLNNSGTTIQSEATT